jgi:hypothetical protein
MRFFLSNAVVLKTPSGNVSKSATLTSTRSLTRRAQFTNECAGSIVRFRKIPDSCRFELETERELLTGITSLEAGLES